MFAGGYFTGWGITGLPVSTSLDSGGMPLCTDAFLSIAAPPLAPQLSLHPKLPVYLPGEKVTLNCSVPHGKEVAGLRFHQHRGDQTPEELPAASGGPWMELMAQMGNDGSYTCQYWRREAGQEIVSENSNSITVPVSGEALTSGMLPPGLSPHLRCC